MKNKTVKIIALCVCFAVICGVVASTSALALWQNSDEYVRLDNDKLRRVQGSVTLLDNKGSVLCEPASVGGKKQTSIAALPKHVYMAFVAVEDKRFFRHGGVDVVRVASALLTNLKSGGKKEGAHHHPTTDKKHAPQRRKNLQAQTERNDTGARVGTQVFQDGNTGNVP